MDPKLEKIQAKLREYRSRDDLQLNFDKMPNLKPTFTGFDGKEHTLKIRYYQVQGVLHLVAMNKFLLGDDCGLGKTLQVIAALCCIWGKNPGQKVLVLAPKSAVGQWGNEFDKFTKGVNVFVADGTPIKRAKCYEQFKKAKGPSVLVTGYEKARQDFTELQKWKNYILVTDEATKYKTPKKNLTQMVSEFASRATRTWALTATLIKNTLIEGYAIMEAIVPGMFGSSKNKFMKEYCQTRMIAVKGRNIQIPIITGYKKSQIAKFKEKIGPYYLGRPKFEVASDLPTLQTRRIACGMSREQKAKYDQALAGLIQIDRPDKLKGDHKGSDELKTEILTALTRCQQIVDHPDLIGCDGKSQKMERLFEVMEDEFPDEKIIIFTRLKEMVNILEPLLKKKKYAPVRVTGDENSRQRDESMRKFQDPKSDTKVILITMAGADAINLQAAKAVIFYDLPYSGGDYLQIIGRMIRIGSVYDMCYAVHLLCKGTIDEKVQSILSRKMQLIVAILGERLKGDEDDDYVIDSRNDMSDIFELMISHARSSKK